MDNEGWEIESGGWSDDGADRAMSRQALSCIFFKAALAASLVTTLSFHVIIAVIKWTANAAYPRAPPQKELE